MATFGIYARNYARMAGLYNESETTVTPTIPKVSLKWCSFNKETRNLSLASEYFGMPAEFIVVSHLTGKEVKFKAISPEHPLYDEDQWDGEQMVYTPEVPVPGINVLVIYNQY